MTAGALVRNRRVVLVTRPTEQELLLERHGTPGQVEFVLTSRGSSLEELERSHHRHLAARHTAQAAIPLDWRRAAIDRADLDRFLFEPDDIVVVVGQDGLVANVAKYLDSGQPVIGIDPEPGRNAGQLVTWRADELGPLLTDVDAGTAPVLERTMVAADLDDGRRLIALNEVFVGHRAHQSARYLLQLGTAVERQSSSGLIVTTGTGATGWAASIHRACRSQLRLPAVDERRLALFVREPWPSPVTGTDLTEGLIGPGEQLTVTSAMDIGATIFGDGIDADALPFDTGRRVTVTVADRSFRHVAALAAA